ncbi:MAG: hypothetical protein NVS3B10_18720 [Polyangiales bacterium]
MKKIWLGAFAAFVMACSSSGGGGTTPAGDTGTGGGGGDGGVGTDTGGNPGTDTGPRADSGSREVSVLDTGPAGDGSVAAENTTGNKCAANAECDPLGTGDDKCSNGLFKSGTLYPTPVCIGVTCDPGAGTTIMACDNNKGVCLSTGSGGICLPVCGFDNSTAAPTGCQGKDGCNVYGWGKDATSGKLNGVGYCFGGCSADADCTGGDKCQKESGLCVKAPIAYTKAVGDACLNTDAGKTCECLYSNKTNKGYCSQACQVGTAGVCGTGYSCSALLPKVDTSGAALFSKSPAGISGYCMKNCATDADCTALNGTCQDTTDGKVCSPFGP